MVAERHEAALLHPHQLADELPDPGTEDGQCKTGNVLVRPQRNGKKTEDQEATAPAANEQTKAIKMARKPFDAATPTDCS